jgi:hypothetical protein
MGNFLRGTANNDLDIMSETLAMVIVECPADWGDPKDPETYANLPFYGAFQDVVNDMTEESKKYTS